MNDVRALLERQANWQKSLRRLTWAEKVRLAARVLPQLRGIREKLRSESSRRPARRT